MSTPHSLLMAYPGIQAPLDPNLFLRSWRIGTIVMLHPLRTSLPSWQLLSSGRMASSAVMMYRFFCPAQLTMATRCALLNDI